MKFKKLNSNKLVNVNITKYRIDWDRKVSGPQKLVKDAVYPYWKNHVCLEEFKLPNSLMRIDLINLSLKVVLEVSPSSTHTKFNEFMHGSRAGYLAVIKRDESKRLWAEQNGFTFIEVIDEDFPLFKSGDIKEWFEERGIDL